MKKIISFAATFILIISLLSSGAFAWAPDDDDDPSMLPNPTGHLDEVVLSGHYDRGTDDLDNGTFGVVFPMTLKAGLYQLDIAVAPCYDGNPYTPAIGGLYEDYGLTTPVNSDEILNHYTSAMGAQEYGQDVLYKITEEREYYLASYVDDPACFRMDIYLTLNKVKDPGSTIKAGYDYGVYGGYYELGKTMDYRYTPTKNGWLEFRPSGNVLITLKTKSGKVLARQKSREAFPVTFGVKKGVTYTVSIAWPTVDPPSGHIFSTQRGTVGLSGGTRRSKASLLKKGAWKNGLVAAGDSTAKWYVLKVPKKSKVEVQIEGETCSKLKFTMYKNNGTKAYSTKYLTYEDRASISHLYWTPKSRLPAGIYYIKVQRGTSTSSGWYGLRWRTYK